LPNLSTKQLFLGDDGFIFGLDFAFGLACAKVKAEKLNQIPILYYSMTSLAACLCFKNFQGWVLQAKQTCIDMGTVSWKGPLTWRSNHLEP
jgi:hypothetical protein